MVAGLGSTEGQDAAVPWPLRTEFTSPTLELSDSEVHARLGNSGLQVQRPRAEVRLVSHRSFPGQLPSILQQGSYPEPKSFLLPSWIFIFF